MRVTARRPGTEAAWRVAAAVAVVVLAWVLPMAFAVMMIGLGATEMDQSIRAAGGQGYREPWYRPMRTATGIRPARGPGTSPAPAGISG